MGAVDTAAVAVQRWLLATIPTALDIVQAQADKLNPGQAADLREGLGMIMSGVIGVVWDPTATPNYDPLTTTITVSKLDMAQLIHELTHAYMGTEFDSRVAEQLIAPATALAATPEEVKAGSKYLGTNQVPSGLQYGIPLVRPPRVATQGVIPRLVFPYNVGVYKVTTVEQNATINGPFAQTLVLYMVNTSKAWIQVYVKDQRYGYNKPGFAIGVPPAALDSQGNVVAATVRRVETYTPTDAEGVPASSLPIGIYATANDPAGEFVLDVE